jgi:outer membrane protein assembly factor BamA
LKPIIYIILFVLAQLTVTAQRSIVFNTIEKRNSDKVEKAHTKFEKLITADTLSISSALNKVQQEFFSQGYLTASIDSMPVVGATQTIWWRVGEEYSLVQLRMKSETASILSQSGLRIVNFENKPFSPTNYARLTASLLKYCSNNGYPFALVKLDSVVVDGSSISASLILDKGPLIVLDTAIVKGTAKISEAYLFNYLSLKPGSAFNESQYKKISLKLKELPFVAEARPFEIEYMPGLARPVFYLQNKKASQFNGVVGVQPDNANAGKVYVTGDVKLRLHNAFGRAELFDLNWNNPLPRTQDLKVKMSYPFILGLPFGVDFDLTLFKKDTIFLEINRQLGFRYLLAGNNSVRVFAGKKTSDLISTKGYSTVTTLPEYADVTGLNYGLGLQLEHLDYRLNPRRGYALDISASAGTRTISKNAKIKAELYDSLDLKTTQYKAEANADIYFPIGQRGVIDIGTIGGFVESPSLFSNELYRFGGLKTLRGFDESSLTASRYVIGKAEVRMILEQNSYLLLFYNQAYYENRSNEAFFSDHPYGFGAGITFETKVGIFSFNYALGSQQDNPILFRAAKIHFGLLNYF